MRILEFEIATRVPTKEAVRKLPAEHTVQAVAKVVFWIRLHQGETRLP